jgi:hypothetical protein
VAFRDLLLICIYPSRPKSGFLNVNFLRREASGRGSFLTDAEYGSEMALLLLMSSTALGSHHGLATGSLNGENLKDFLRLGWVPGRNRSFCRLYSGPPLQRRMGNGELRIRNEGRALEASREILIYQSSVPHSLFHYHFTVALSGKRLSMQNGEWGAENSE